MGRMYQAMVCSGATEDALCSRCEMGYADGHCVKEGLVDEVEGISLAGRWREQGKRGWS